MVRACAEVVEECMVDKKDEEAYSRECLTANVSCVELSEHGPQLLSSIYFPPPSP